jgi:hypothetical protein
MCNTYVIRPKHGAQTATDDLEAQTPQPDA